MSQILYTTDPYFLGIRIHCSMFTLLDAKQKLAFLSKLLFFFKKLDIFSTISWILLSHSEKESQFLSIMFGNLFLDSIKICSWTQSNPPRSFPACR